MTIHTWQSGHKWGNAWLFITLTHERGVLEGFSSFCSTSLPSARCWRNRSNCAEEHTRKEATSSPPQTQRNQTTSTNCNQQTDKRQCEFNVTISDNSKSQQCHAVSCSVMQCHAVSCSVMQCHAVSWVLGFTNTGRNHEAPVRNLASEVGTWLAHVYIFGRKTCNLSTGNGCLRISIYPLQPWPHLDRKWNILVKVEWNETKTEIQSSWFKNQLLQPVESICQSVLNYWYDKIWYKILLYIYCPSPHRYFDKCRPSTEGQVALLQGRSPKGAQSCSKDTLSTLL